MGHRLTGAALFLLGGWLVWIPLYPALLYINRGATIAETVVDPVFLLPMVRGVAAMTGGVLAMNALRGSVWWAGGAAVLSLAVGGLIAAVGQGAVPYVPHLLFGLALAVLTAGLVRFPRAAPGST